MNKPRKSTSKMEVRGLHFYKYICVFDSKTKKRIRIPFKLAHTDDYEIALHRKKQVENKAYELARLGIAHKIKEYKFDWMTQTGKAEFKKPISFKEGYDLFVDKRKVAQSTIMIYINSLDHWRNSLPHTISCEDIDSKHLIEFIERHKGNRSDTSINMDLRVLR